MFHISKNYMHILDFQKIFSGEFEQVNPFIKITCDKKTTKAVACSHGALIFRPEIYLEVEKFSLKRLQKNVSF